MSFLSSWSIRKKLLLLVLIAILPALGIILESGMKHRRHEIDAAKRNISLLVQGLAAQQEQVTAGIQQMLGGLAREPELQTLNAKACRRLFVNLHKQNPNFSIIAALTPDGKVFAASAPFPPGNIDLADRTHVRDAIRTHHFSAGEYVTERISKVPSISFTYPVFDKKNRLIAIVVAAFRLDQYRHFISRAALPKDSSVGIIDRNGILLYHFPETEKAYPGIPISQKARRTIPADSMEGFYEGMGLDGVQRIYSYRRLTLQGNKTPYLAIYTGIAKNNALRQANSELLRNLILLGIAASFAIALTWTFGNLIIAKPLDRLVLTTKRLGNGETNTRTGLPHTSDEVGKLIVAFDAMAEELEHKEFQRRRAENALRDSEEKFRLLVENSHDIIYSLSSDGTFIFVSPAWTRLLGHPVSEVAGKTFQPFVHPDDLPGCMAFLHSVIETGNREEGIEYRVRHVDGAWYWHTSSAVPFRDAADTVVGFYGIARDITERKKKEEDTKELISTLQKALEEIKTLRGIVPICSSCKKIRNDKGYWEQVEAYVSKHTEAKFSHGICPDCMNKLYAEYDGVKKTET